MSDSRYAIGECRVVGEYIEEAEGEQETSRTPSETGDRPPRAIDLGGGDAQSESRTAAEIVRTIVVGSFIDDASPSGELREFTVLLRDGRTAEVRGHGLKHTPHPVEGQDLYSVVLRAGSEGDVVVAFFKSADVAGIFDGRMRPDRSIAS